MRCVSPWCLGVVGATLAAALTSPLRGDDTLKFRSATPVQPDSDAATASPPPLTPPQPQAAPTPTASPLPRAFPRLGSTAPAYGQPFFDPRVTNQPRQASGFYGGHSARATLSQLPRRMPLQPASPQPFRRHAKPFERVHHEPTVSPYLNLFRQEEEESAPNYFAFVRPQMEQLDANRMQQREIQQLRRQLYGMSATVVGPQYQAAGMPGTGTAARYMDTAQFYGNWRR